MVPVFSSRAEELLRYSFSFTERPTPGYSVPVVVPGDIVCVLRVMGSRRYSSTTYDWLLLCHRFCTQGEERKMLLFRIRTEYAEEEILPLSV